MSKPQIFSETALSILEATNLPADDDTEARLLATVRHYQEREAAASQALLRVSAKLEAWAIESRTGGWSTHQVDPQRKLALEIRSSVIGTGRYEDINA